MMKYTSESHIYLVDEIVSRRIRYVVHIYAESICVHSIHLSGNLIRMNEISTMPKRDF